MLDTHNIRVYQVGGSVRDHLLGVKSKDIDYAVEAPSFEAMVQWIAQQNARLFQVKSEFGTVRAQFPGDVASDFVLCRKDGFYSDGRRPDKVESGTLLDDLARRDFTVNAIAYDAVTQSYIDPHGGIDDLQQRLLRCVGKAYDRFAEDSLRLLRAMRFSICKKFTLHSSIMDCLRSDALLQLLNNVSNERKRDELLLCFSHSTQQTLKFLSLYPGLADCIFASEAIWLLPTMRKVPI